MTVKYSIPSFLFSTVLLLILITSACTSHSNEPQHPPSVPKEAFWLGGSDGGAFVLIHKDPRDPPNIYQAQIFYHHGENWYSGPLAASKKDQESLSITNRNIFLGWDGEALILTNGRELRPPQSYR